MKRFLGPVLVIGRWTKRHLGDLVALVRNPFLLHQEHRKLAELRAILKSLKI
jgi:hypothetical protein